MNYIKRYSIGFFACMLLAVFFVGSGSTSAAETTNKNSTTPNVITRTYNADGNVQTGMFVGLKDKDASTVVALKKTNSLNFLGVVVPASSASIVLSPNSINKQQTLVSTSGRLTVLVTNQNGPIKAGDDLTMSSIDGVAMRASSLDEDLVGKAVTAYNGGQNTVGQITVKDSTGKSKNFSIGRTVVDVFVTHNPKFQRQADYMPSFILSIAQSAAGKSVSVARIYISLAILLATVIIVGNILYAGVRTGMIAIGRNPLSRKSIFRSLIQTAIVAIIILLIGLFAVYLLLKL